MRAACPLCVLTTPRRPEKVVFGTSIFIGAQLGQEFVEAPPFDLEVRAPAIAPCCSVAVAAALRAQRT